MPSHKKIVAVQELSKKIKNAKSIVLMDYRGISASDEGQLRKKVRSSNGVEYIVAKNRLFKIAMRESEFGDGLSSVLQGPTSFMLSYEDAMVGPKLTKEFQKVKKDVFKIKGGTFESRVMSASALMEIASLPSKDVMIARLLAQLNAPIQKLCVVLKMISEIESKS
jgi:large subunit ribosomal protein L10